MDLEQIREILDLVAESGVAEVEIEEDDFRLVVRKTAPTVTLQSAGGAGYGMPMMPPYAQGHPQQPQPQQQPAVPPDTAGGAGGPPQQAAPAPAPSPDISAGGQGEEEEGGGLAPGDVHIRAPIVGTFYRRPSPDSDPFVEVGDTVKEGDVLCIIEAMKLMNEIESEESGTVKEILIEDAQPVEYDQPLFVIEA